MEVEHGRSFWLFLLLIRRTRDSFTSLGFFPLLMALNRASDMSVAPPQGLDRFSLFSTLACVAAAFLASATIRASYFFNAASREVANPHRIFSS